MRPNQKFSPIPLHDLKAQYESIRTDVALAIAGVLERQDFVLGREVRELEREIAQICGISHAVACASGSDALLLALMALEIKPGDEVLVPTFTFFATAGMVSRLGARPVFVDIEPRSFNVSIAGMQDALRRHPNARAAIPVDLFGQVVDFDELRAALPPGLPMIEDAAQAILAEYKGSRAGTLGQIGTFSFFPSKNLGAYGDAGMLVTGNAAIAERVSRLRGHGSKDRYFHDEVGFNSRLDTLQAAVLLVKLRHLEAWTAQRQAAAGRYTRLFTGSGLVDPNAVYPSKEHPVALPRVEPGAPRGHVFHQYSIRTLERDALRAALEQAAIASAIYYPLPLHLQRCFAFLGGKAGDCPEAERAAGEVLSLPIFPEITEEQQERVVKTITEFYRR